MKTAFALLALAATTTFAASASADAVVVKKYFGAASVTNVNLQSLGQTVAVDLTGSRKKRVLVVHATASQDAGGTTPQAISLQVKANDVRLEPGLLTNRCEKSHCTVSGTFFMNMADAELANPGLFYNTLPMTVEATGNSTATGIGKVSLTADLLRR